MYTIVDVGSNTVRMNVYDIRDKKLKLLFSKKETVGLASYVRGQYMSAAGIEKVISVLEEFRDVLNNLNIHEMHVFATAALRNVDNSQEAVEEINRRTGLQVQVISGREEAELDFLGAAIESNIKKGLLVDIGGGSTELVAYKDGRIRSAISIAKGSLNSYNKYVKGILPTKEERKNIKKDFVERLEGLQDFESKNKYKLICGVGGTVRAALKLDRLLFGKSAAENILPVSHIGYIIKSMESKNNRDKFLQNLSILLDVVPERIRTIMPGMIILYAIAKRFKCEAIMVANTGVREGFMYNYVLSKDEPSLAEAKGTETELLDKLGEDLAEGTENSAPAEKGQVSGNE